MLFLQIVIVLGIIHTAFSLWPLPQKLSVGTSELTLNSNFGFLFVPQIGQGQSQRLLRGISRYDSLISVPKSSVRSTHSSISSCSMSVKSILSSDEEEVQSLKPGVDESYSLSISSSGVCSISSNTIWGALYAMETFTQLLIRQTENVVCTSLPVSISDFSRFSHRGLLVDTSRHFLSVDELLRMVDTLPMSKFNVLHWHVVDAQSFPLDLPSAPQMKKGAYSPTLVYTTADISNIVSYSADRGVRVVIEVDVPGHAASWQYGEPSIMADCIEHYTNVNNYALNPTLEDTYTVLGSVLSDIVKASGSSYLHLGGDEVVYGCWKNDATITAWMNANQMTSYDSLLSYFVLKADAIARSLGVTPMHWEEVFQAGVKVDKDTIFEVWTNSSQVLSVVSAGYQTIAAPSNYWYLNQLATTWTTMYAYNPTSGLTSSEAALIVGGEAAIWGEYIDESNIESVVYPRAFAVGERLWSASTVTDSTAAKPRLLDHRCRMVQRGFRSAPVEPGFCAVQFV